MAIRLAAFTKNGVNPNYQAFLRGVERAAAAEGATATRHVPATPEAIRRMNAELSPLSAPGSELSRRMAERGSKVLLTGPEPLTARLRAEVAQWRQVVATAGITPE